MDLIRLTSADAKSPAMECLVKIYTDAIATSEQKSRQTLEAMLANTHYYFYVSSIERQLVGFAIVYSPDYSDYCLLEYMAVSSSYRNRGYGGEIFDSLTSIFREKHMIIEIDSHHQQSTDQTTRKKRMAFYRQHGGLCVEQLRYILPLKTDGAPPDMLLMLHSSSYRDFIPKTKLTSWITDIYTSVYGCSPTDPRITLMVGPLPENVPLAGI